MRAVEASSLSQSPMFDFDVVHTTNDVNPLLRAKHVDRLIESNGFNTFM